MAFEPFIHLMRGIQSRFSTAGIRSTPNIHKAEHHAYLRQLQRDIRQDDVLKIPLNELEVVVLDIETTGFYPEKGDEIISIGAIKIRNGSVQEDEQFYSLIQCNNEIPEEISTLTSITNEQVRDAPPLSEVLMQFFRFAQNCTLVAHHAKHEKVFLQNASLQLYRTPLKHRILDTSFLFRIADPELKILRLEEFCEYHNIPIENRHHALEDAKVTAKLWCIYIEKVQRQGCNNLREMYERLALLN